VAVEHGVVVTTDLLASGALLPASAELIPPVVPGWVSETQTLAMQRMLRSQSPSMVHLSPLSGSLMASSPHPLETRTQNKARLAWRIVQRGATG
jgi:hypothetical protein